MFQKLFAAASVATCCLFNPAGIQEAKAQSVSYSGHIAGYEVTYLYDSGTYGGWDTIHVYGPNGL